MGWTCFWGGQVLGVDVKHGLEFGLDMYLGVRVTWVGLAFGVDKYLGLK